MHILLIVFVASLLIQAIYVLSVNYAFSRYRKPGNEEKKPVSVIIAARNEESNLLKLLPDLEKQLYPEFEVLVVDNGSQDQTSQIAGKFEHVRIIPSGIAPTGFNGKKWALAKGIEAARYDQLIFTDADVRIGSDHWLSEMMKGFETDSAIVLGVSPYLRSKGFLNRFVQYETFFTAFQYIGFALLGKPYMAVGRNMGYSRSIWESGGGFRGIEEIRGGDDDLFVNRNVAGSDVRVVLGNESLVYSYPKETIREFFRQKIRHLSVGRNYSVASLVLSGSYLMSLLVFWGTGLTMLFSGWELFLVLTGFAIRYAFWIPACIESNKKMGTSFEWAYLIPLDIIYPVYYISAAIGTLWAKKIQWK